MVAAVPEVDEGEADGATVSDDVQPKKTAKVSKRRSTVPKVDTE